MTSVISGPVARRIAEFRAAQEVERILAVADYDV